MSPRAFWTMNYDQTSCAIDQEVWTRIRTFVLQCSTMISPLLRDHLGLLSCNAQCSTVIYFSAFELSTSKKYSLITQAFLGDCCLWKEYIFTRPRSVSVNFLLSSQTKMEFASLLEWSLVHLSFSQLYFCQCWLTLNVCVFVPLAMFSFLSFGDVEIWCTLSQPERESLRVVEMESWRLIEVAQ